MKNEIVLKPSHWAFVSGGKDSLYMLNLILHNLDKYPLDGVVHFELEIDYPFIKNVINYMESECKRFGIPFFRIKPRTKWIDFYNKYGFPTCKARWCNSKYKLDCLKQLDEYLNTYGCYTVSYIGYCADEVKRYSKRALLDGKEQYPLVEAGIAENTILDWAKKQPIFNDYYKYNRRCGCMYCPLQSMQDTAYLMKYYPAEYKQMIAYAKATEEMREETLGRPFSVWTSNPKYNTEYRDKRVREVYLPKLEEQLKRAERGTYVRYTEY
jgi:3'-phosphoadenosine 5'-phosphosulfate sulfotransferase (PAPS reductase)/FAD synthetase